MRPIGNSHFLLVICVLALANSQNDDGDNELADESINNLDTLYEKLEKTCESDAQELRKLKELRKIMTEIKNFENEMIQENNKTSVSHLKYGWLNSRITEFVILMATNIAKVVDTRAFFASLREGISSALTCLSCNSLLSLVFNKLFSADTLAIAFIQICKGLDLTTNDVCEGYINTFKDQIDYIRHKSPLTTMEMCGLLMGDQCFTGQSPHLHWKLTLPVKLNVTVKPKEPFRKKKVYKIMQITDIHLDLEYTPLTDDKCGTPYCCRSTGTDLQVNKSLNYWGSYPCDTPIQTMDNWFRNIDWKNIDLIYWTGDVTPHDSWRETRLKSIQTSQVINNYLKVFTKNKMVVPVFGNHVAVPIGSFPPPGIDIKHSISWLYEDMAQQWAQWLPSDSLDLFKRTGYFSMKIRPGFRIIVVNTNYCARLNIWILFQSIDLSDQLKWLIKELLIAEEAGDLVHVVGHIPPDDRECTQSWLYNYMKIVERFSDTIVGQFFGHTHYDEFRVLYSVQNGSKPIGVEIISPSLTTYSEVNPAYRVISCRHNGRIVDMDTYAFDLAAANSKPDSMPDWYHEYSMAKEYAFKSFDSREFDLLMQSIETNDDILQKFFRFSHRNSTYVKSVCDNDCKLKIINNIKIRNPFLQKPKPIYEKKKIDSITQ